MNIGVNQRDRGFQRTIRQEDSRREREETQHRIRKAKKEQRFKSRRALPITGSTDDDEEVVASQKFTLATTNVIHSEIQEQMGVYRLWKENPNAVTLEQIIETTKSFRRMLTSTENPPTDAVVQAGAHYFFVEFLANYSSPTLQFEAAWALTNIASTEHTSKVVEAAGIPALVPLLLYSDKPDVREQAVWCIGNIAGDCVAYRDRLLNTEGLREGIIKNFEEPTSAGLLQNFVWAVSNLCRHKPVPDIHLIEPFIDHIAKFTDMCQNQMGTIEFSEEMYSDCIWALSYISDGDNARIQRVMETGILRNLMHILQHERHKNHLLIPAVRCLGNFVSGTEAQTDAVLRADFLKYVLELMDHPSRGVRKDICWTLSNIGAGTEEQITALFTAERRSRIVQRLIEIGRNAPLEVRKEAVWAISNIITTGSDEHMKYIVQMGGIETLCRVLKEGRAESSLIVVTLEAIKHLLHYSCCHNLDYLNLLADHNGIEFIEDLQENANDNVYQLAMEIITEYIGVEEDDEMQNVAPAVTGQTFDFGLSSNLGDTSKQLFAPGSSPKFDFGGTRSANFY